MKGRLYSKFSYAFSGIRAGFLSELNIRIEFFLGLLALLISAFLKISSLELALILAFVALVLGFEYFNTGLEWFVDQNHKERSPFAKYIKDSAAAAVLIASISALLCAALIWIPRLSFLLKHGFSYSQTEVLQIAVSALLVIVFPFVCKRVPLKTKADLLLLLEEK